MESPNSPQNLSSLTDSRADEQDSRRLTQKAVLMETKAQEYLDGLPRFNHQVSRFTAAEYLANIQTKMSTSSSDDEDASSDEVTTQDPTLSVDVYEDLRTGLCYDPRMRFHVEIATTGMDSSFHPEDPRRIIAIYKLFCEHGLVENPQYAPLSRLVGRPLQRIPARYATKEECCRVHTSEHFEDVHETAGANDETLISKTLTSDSVYYNQSTYSSALLAAGSAIDTILAVVKGEVRNAIAVIRPPGHHAETDRSGGFCHFDNVAVAVRTAQHQHPEIKKVLIIDWDIHHGNGIQQAFEEDPNVLYISIHVHAEGRFYPPGPAGGIPMDGKGAGKGKNINIGWKDTGRKDGDYLMAFQHIIMPVAHEFNPDLVVIASGFDAADGDYLGGCHVTPPCYAQMTHMLMSLADGKVVVCLEGGYNLVSISDSALAVTKTLMGRPPPRISNAKATNSGAQTIFKVIKHHSQYWQSLVPKAEGKRFHNAPGAIRLHDVVRSHQADQYFKDYRMHPLPIYRDKPKEFHSMTFEGQVLATRGFRSENELLIIFHDSPEIEGAADHVDGVTSPSGSKVHDIAQSFIGWAVDKKIGVIDVNLPDFYTGLSDEGGDEVAEQNKITARVQLCAVADHLWQDYVSLFQGSTVVLLGLGNAFYAAQRLYATHGKGDMDKYNVRAVGVVQDDVPGTPPAWSMEHFDHWYHKWTTIWVPHSHKIFVESKNGKPKKKYGGVRPSQWNGLSHMVAGHDRDIKNRILEHFNRSPEPSSPELSGREDSVASEGSVLGKRPRETDDVGVGPAPPKMNGDSVQVE